jgi:asparagine synthase (glutamine-hydrolysing)
MEWDAEWSNNPDPSGRAALGVHLSDYQNLLKVQNGVAQVPSMEDGRIQKAAVKN